MNKYIYSNISFTNTNYIIFVFSFMQPYIFILCVLCFDVCYVCIYKAYVQRGQTKKSCGTFLSDNDIKFVMHILLVQYCVCLAWIQLFLVFWLLSRHKIIHRHTLEFKCRKVDGSKRTKMYKKLFSRPSKVVVLKSQSEPRYWLPSSYYYYACNDV